MFCELTSCFKIILGSSANRAAVDWWLQGGLSNEAFEDNFIPDIPQISAAEVREVYRERDELRTQLECATDELRQYKPEYVDLSCCLAHLILLLFLILLL